MKIEQAYKNFTSKTKSLGDIYYYTKEDEFQKLIYSLHQEYDSSSKFILPCNYIHQTCYDVLAMLWADVKNNELTEDKLVDLLNTCSQIHENAALEWAKTYSSYVDEALMDGYADSRHGFMSLALAGYRLFTKEIALEIISFFEIKITN